VKSWARPSRGTCSIIEADEIDRINIHRASLKAMREAVMELVPLPGFVIVDGFRIPELPIPQRPIIGGDRRSTAIAAASILAKVTRDRIMVELHAADPRYGFDRH
jgi:ribonuclease HII